MNALANYHNWQEAKHAREHGVQSDRDAYIEIEAEARSKDRSWVIDGLRNLLEQEEFFIANQLIEGDFMEAGRLLDEAVLRHLARGIDAELGEEGR